MSKDKSDSDKVVPISKGAVGRATGASGRTRGKSSPRHQGLTDKQEAFYPTTEEPIGGLR